MNSKNCLKVIIGVLCMTSVAVHAMYEELSPFHRALFKGDVAAAKEAYDNASPDEKKSLLTEPVSIDEKTAWQKGTYPEIFSWCPMHFAAAGGSIEVAEYLIQLGTPIHVVASMGKLPLHMAAKYGHSEMVKWLVNADKQWCEENNKEFSIEWKTSNFIGYEDRDATALYLACLYGHADVVQTLLEFGAEHTPDTIADKAVHLAARGGSVEVMAVLKKWGADLGKTGIFDGDTPLGIAQKNEHNALVTYLRNQGCTVEHVYSPGDRLSERMDQMRRNGSVSPLRCSSDDEDDALMDVDEAIGRADASTQVEPVSTQVQDAGTQVENGDVSHGPSVDYPDQWYRENIDAIHAQQREVTLAIGDFTELAQNIERWAEEMKEEDE